MSRVEEFIEMATKTLLSMSDRQIKIEPELFVKTVRPGEHGCIFFTNQDDMRKLHYAYVLSGLEQNMGVVYATPSESYEETQNAMRRYGIDIERYQQDNSLLVVKGEDIYKEGDKPDLENAKNTVKAVVEGFLSKGKEGVRIAGDLTSYFLPRGLLMEWFNLESLFERQSSLPLTVLCAYDANQISATKDLDIMFYYKKINKEWTNFVDAHSFAIYVSNDKSVTFTI
jgi:hypothetical protein